MYKIFIMIIYIYALQNPETKQIRYVGKTGNIKNRFNSHLSSSQKLKTHLGSWIKSLINNNLIPEIIILEECDENNWEEREKYWISQYSNLVNIQKGGNEPYIHKKALKKYSKSGNKYKVNCSYNNTVYYLGTFETIEEAQRTYDEFQINPQNFINKSTNTYNKTSILMYKDNVLIKEYKSVSECSKDLNIPVSNISANCRGKYKTCRGYVFKYKNLTEEE